MRSAIWTRVQWRLFSAADAPNYYFLTLVLISIHLIVMCALNFYGTKFGKNFTFVETLCSTYLSHQAMRVQCHIQFKLVVYMLWPYLHFHNENLVSTLVFGVRESVFLRA